MLLLEIGFRCRSVGNIADAFVRLLRRVASSITRASRLGAERDRFLLGWSPRADSSVLRARSSDIDKETDYGSVSAIGREPNRVCASAAVTTL